MLYKILITTMTIIIVLLMIYVYGIGGALFISIPFLIIYTISMELENFDYGNLEDKNDERKRN